MRAYTLLCHALLTLCVLAVTPSACLSQSTGTPATPTNLRLSGARLVWTQPTSGASARGWNVYLNDAYKTTVTSAAYTLPAGEGAGNTYYVVAFDYTPGTPNFSAKSARYNISAATGGGSSTTSALLARPRTLLWSDEFSGAANSRANPAKWTYWTPAASHRTGYLTADHAFHDGAGHLVMQAVVRNNRAEMSYLRSFDDVSPTWMEGFPKTNDFLLDPAPGPLYIETAVKFSGAAQAFRAWWAFWFMGPNWPQQGYANYDGNPATGTEVDAFEFVPDVSPYGWNMAIYKAQDGGLRPGGRSFSVENGRRFLSSDGQVGSVNLMDGRYHTIGVYYSTERYVVYIDGVPAWDVKDAGAVAQWVTRGKKNGIRMTWEADDGNVWGAADRPGETFVSRGTDARVLIDYVRVSRVG